MRTAHSFREVLPSWVEEQILTYARLGIAESFTAPKVKVAAKGLLTEHLNDQQWGSIEFQVERGPAFIDRLTVDEHVREHGIAGAVPTLQAADGGLAECLPGGAWSVGMKRLATSFRPQRTLVMVAWWRLVPKTLSSVSSGGQPAIGGVARATPSLT